MAGSLVLVGGDEFRPACAEMDREILARSPTSPARVLILPTAAAAERPDLAAANGVAHFQGLGAVAAPLMVVDWASANDGGLVAQVEEASLIYLAGGDPDLLLRTLQDSRVWRAVLEAHQEGAVLAGSSAGAMVLAGWMSNWRDGWVEALALVPRLAILPHHERASPQWVRTARKGLGEETILLGIDGATACVTEEGDSWDVLGAGSATLYFPGGTATYLVGESFPL